MSIPKSVCSVLAAWFALDSCVLHGLDATTSAEAMNRRWPTATYENDNYLSGDKDSWLLAALLAMNETHSTSDAPVAAPLPPGYLLLNGMHGLNMNEQSARSARILSWHLHFDAVGAPLYTNSRQL
eukprot:SAG31_NODE_17749_length_659_cov_0.942857_1_plen_125_part_10